MTLTAIKEKMENAKTAYEKRQATTAKFMAQADKHFKTMQENGWDGDKYRDTITRSIYNKIPNPYEYYNPYTAWTAGNKKAGDTIDKYKSACRNADESAKKEEELKQKYNEWVDKYNNALRAEKDIDNLPEVFQEAINYLATTWTGYDIKKRDAVNNLYERLQLAQAEYNKVQHELINAPLEYVEYVNAHKKFEETYGKQVIEERNAYNRAYQVYRDVIGKTDEELLENNTDNARYYIRDLVNRIKNRVGEITSFKNLRFSGNALNGFVTGTTGKVELETIIAGGLIQRDHYRVIVHPCK